MKYYYIRFELDNRIANLHFHRLDKLNAINFEMVKEMNHALSNFDNTQANVLFIHGHRKAFSAGGDLKEMQTLSQTEAEKRSKYIHETFAMIKNLPIPVVAFIQGICYGGGLELALHGDYRICSSESKFAFPEVKFGMIPGAGGTVNFPAEISKAEAAYYLFTGEEFSASRAYELQLVQKLVLSENFDAEVKQTKQFYEKANTDSLRALKLQLKGLNNTDQNLLNSEAELFAELLSKSGQDGIKSNFLR